MLKIRHITKSGEVEKIDGYIVKMNDAKAVYHLIDKINRRVTK